MVYQITKDGTDWQLSWQVEGSLINQLKKLAMNGRKAW